VILTVAVAAVCGQTQAAEPVDAERLAAFERFVLKWMADEHVPAITVGFSSKATAFGSRRSAMQTLKTTCLATADSAYRLASVQKSMTAVAVLQLAEQGLLDLDAEIQTYVPYFYPRKQHPVTVRLLLAHLAGIPHYVDRDAEQHIKTHKTTREAIAISRTSPAVRAGTAVQLFELWL
jgi:CubicO group peptidase (beta-lactamase class C family)